MHFVLHSYRSRGSSYPAQCGVLANQVSLSCGRQLHRGSTCVSRLIDLGEKIALRYDSPHCRPTIPSKIQRTISLLFPLIACLAYYFYLSVFSLKLI